METFVGHVSTLEEREGQKGPYTYLEVGNERFYVHGAQGKSVLQEFRAGSPIEVRFERNGKFKNVKDVVPFTGQVPAQQATKAWQGSGNNKSSPQSRGKSPEEQQRIEDGMIYNKAMEYLISMEEPDAATAVGWAVDTFYEVKRVMGNRRQGIAPAKAAITD